MNYSYELLNSHPRFYIPTGNLRIAPYEIEQMLEVVVRHKINEHSTLYLKGILVETNGDKCAELSTKGESVTLSAIDATGEETIVFQGIVKEAEIHIEQNTRHIEVQAISYTYLLDIEKKSRSFQNKKNTYASLFSQVTGAYSMADVIDAASNGAQTGKFIMQHQETDWEFMKRLASHFNTGLIPDARFDSPKYFIGVPETRSAVLDNASYTVKKDITRFRQLSENGVKGLSDQDFICYEVETNHMARVGDEIAFQNKHLHVYEIESVARQGFFINRLLMMPINGFRQMHISNTGVVGASYGGYILESKNDMVKVRLDTDKGHNPGEPCFFPYSTIYSSKDGSGWYCMPETGDTVRIYFPDGEDDHAYAFSSVHESVNTSKSGSGGGMRATGAAGSYSGQRDDPKVKSLTYGDKEVRLTPDGVYIIMDSSMITMTPKGITLMSENDIAFKSDKSIYMSAEEDINIIGSESVEIMCGETTGVMIEDNVQVIGQEVKAN